MPQKHGFYRGGTGWVILISIILALLTALVLVRYGARTPQGRTFVEARLSGLKLGRIGRLRIEGLSGDIWSDFSVRRLTIADEGGVWLEADGVHVDWRSAALFSRLFQARALKADQLLIMRRPTLTKRETSGLVPVSINIDHFATRLVLQPAFSGVLGDYAVSGAYHLARRGGQGGRVAVLSRLHAGDYLKAEFDIGRAESLKLQAEAREAAGGALAGTLGLDPNRTFKLDATADGKISEGRFTLDVQRGADHPARAAGNWTARSGSASGAIDLSASSLTAPYGAKFGRQVGFAISGKATRNDFYDLTGSLTGANLTLIAEGQGNPSKRQLAPKGLNISVQIGDLSKVVPTPALGPGQLQAVLTGGRGAWSLDGIAKAQRLQIGGYRLERFEGPAHLKVKNGEVDLKADFSGQGGAGAGTVASLLGVKPVLAFQGTRLKDGRLLLRQMDATGAGINLHGKGTRGLLGDLSFKGNLILSNLAAIRDGAKGRLIADVSANQVSGGKPWQLVLDGQGSDFVSGVGEADRLLGAKPMLSLRAALDRESLAVTSASLIGAAAQASGAGTIIADELALTGNWSATGPFRAGPLEIGGTAKGTSIITGSLDAPAVNLAADFDSIDFPRMPLRMAHLDLNFRPGGKGADGEARLIGTSAYGPARAAATFRFTANGLDLTGLDAEAGGVQAKGFLALRRNAPSTADLTLAISPGVLIESGRIIGSVKIADATGGPTATVDLTAENVLLRDINLSLTTAHVSGSGALADLPLTIQARGAAPAGRWRVELISRLQATAPAGYSLVLQGAGELGKSRVSTREAAVLRWDADRRTARLRLLIGQGTADFDISQQGDALSLDAALSGTDLSAFDQDLAGGVDARISARGKGSELTGTLDVTLKGARERGAAAAKSLDGQIKATLGGGLLKISGAAGTPQGLKASGQFSAPTVASVRPLSLAIDRTKPMAGQFDASGEVQPLWDLFIGGERSLSGRADISAAVGGSLAEPQVTGRGSLEGGVFEDGGSGLKLQNVLLRMALSQTGVDLKDASGDDGAGGRIAAAGRFDLRRGAESDLRLDLKGFRVIDNSLGKATASGQTLLSRAADGRMKLAGAITIDRADLAASTPNPTGVATLDVIERNRPPDLETDLIRPPPQGPGMAFDLALNAPRRVFVKGRGLDVEMSLDAHLTGNSNAPILAGAARVVRGQYDFAGKRFEFDDRGVVYLAAQPDLIRLALTAVRDDPALTATVNIKGTAARPEITLTSSPSLPNDEVLSQVLFGASAAQLSPLEAAQLASALAALSGGGGFDVIGNLRSFARLDRLAFAGDAAGGTTIAGGKYVTDDVYLEVIGGGREGPAAQVEWRVKRNLSLVSRFSASRDGMMSVRWRRDY